jgi:hypothetical protein
LFQNGFASTHEVKGTRKLLLALPPIANSRGEGTWTNQKDGEKLQDKMQRETSPDRLLKLIRTLNAFLARHEKRALTQLHGGEVTTSMSKPPKQSITQRRDRVA